MRSPWLLCFGTAAILTACEDQTGNHTFPETELDEVPAALSNQGHVRITFRALGNANTFICRLDNGDSSMCISPFEADVADGEHTFEVAAALNQNVDETPSTYTWKIDTVKPETVLVAVPPALDNATNPTFTFSGTDGGVRAGAVTFECALDGAAFAACTSPHAVTVTDGAHTFTVRAKDEAGNVDPSPANHNWTVDLTAPETQITTGPAAGSTSPASGSFEFDSPEAGATFECQFDGAAFAACTSPKAFTLASGPHTFTVRAKDAASTVDPSPAIRAWTVDATPPDVAITSAPSNPSNDASPPFGFGSTDATATFECRVDAGAFAACASPFTTASLADGSHTFRVRSIDGVGNVSTTTATVTWVIDTVAPTVTITAAPAALSNDTTPSVSFTTAGSPTAIECQVDAGAFAACTSPFTSAALADGAHSITVRATDAAGNPGMSAASFTIDTVPPTVTITSAPPSLSNDPTPSVAFTTAGAPTSVQCRVDAGAFGNCASPFTSAALADGAHSITVRATDGAGNAGTATASFTIDTAPPAVTLTAQPPALTNDTTPSVSFTTTGAPTAVECQVDGGAFAACTSPFTSAALADGAHSITVRATDGAGNTDTATASFTIDATPPTVAITAEPSALSNDPTPSVTFTTGGSPTTIQCRVDAAAFAACTSPFTATAQADGAHTISVRVTDAAGNQATDTTNSFTIDTVAPTVSITAQPAALSNDNTPSVSFTTGGAPTATECRLDAGTFAACTSPFSTAVADGAHTITVRVTDGAGNTSSATTASFTVDTVAPTVSITGEPAALSNDTSPTVTFTTGGSPTTITCQLDTGTAVNCTSPFTTTVAAGTHTITVRVADGAGNASTDTTNSFTVDTTAPTVSITAEPAALSNDNTPSVSFTTGGSPTAIECRVDAGTFAACTSPFTSGALADGAHTISVRVSDGAGNQATDTTNSFTIDTVAPTVSITAQPAALSNDNTPTVTFTTGGSPTAIECRLDAGTFAACTSPFTTTVTDGAHTITIRVTDGATNTTSATTGSFTVDTAPPTLTLDEVPPAQWPVNYFDVRFTAGGATSTECSLNGAAFAACTSPHAITTVYGTASTLQVRARDAANNTTTRTASWTSTTGLILHYAWEQGSTQNTSLLAQVASHSPDGSAALPGTSVIGGWAGTAITNVAAHKYVDTFRALSSSPNQNYAVSFWMRTDAAASGTVLTTIPGNNAAGLRVVISGRTIQVEVADNGQVFTGNTAVALNRWIHVGMRTTGAAKGLEVFINGVFAFIIAPPVGNGFGPGQLASMEVGSFSGPLDIDDLRFFNRSFSNAEICTVLGRGTIDANGGCQPLAPGFELDMERGELVDTGVWRPVFSTANASPTFVGTKTGNGMQLANSPRPWGFAQLLGFALNTPGTSIAMWLNATASSNGILWDSTRQCVVGGPPTLCGVRISLTGTRIDVLAGTSLANSATRSATLTAGMHSVVITERRTGSTSQDVTIFVDGSSIGTIALGASNIWEMSSGNVLLPTQAGQLVDEIELWTDNLARDPQLLCENGFDGEFDLASGTCSLTSN